LYPITARLYPILLAYTEPAPPHEA
jgi:hypothetical protein